MADNPISPDRVPISQSENAGEKQAKHANKGRFTKGKSGNPAGKPRGTRNRATMLAEALLDGETEEIVRSVIGRAKGGDTEWMASLSIAELPVRAAAANLVSAISALPMSAANMTLREDGLAIVEA